MNERERAAAAQGWDACFTSALTWIEQARQGLLEPQPGETPGEANTRVAAAASLAVVLRLMPPDAVNPYRRND